MPLYFVYKRGGAEVVMSVLDLFPGTKGIFLFIFVKPIASIISSRNPLFTYMFQFNVELKAGFCTHASNLERLSKCLHFTCILDMIELVLKHRSHRYCGSIKVWEHIKANSSLKQTLSRAC